MDTWSHLIGHLKHEPSFQSTLAGVLEERKKWPVYPPPDKV